MIERRDGPRNQLEGVNPFLHFENEEHARIDRVQISKWFSESDECINIMVKWASAHCYHDGSTIPSSLPLLPHHRFCPSQVICHSSVRVRRQAVVLVSALLLRCAASLSASEKLLLVRHLGLPFNLLLPPSFLGLSHLLEQHFPAHFFRETGHPLPSLYLSQLFPAGVAAPAGSG